MSAALQNLVNQPYKHGFVTDIESDIAPPGLSEDTIRLLSTKKGEPRFMLDWRLKAYKHWLGMTEPTWAKVHYPKIDYQNVIYYSAPKQKKKLASMDEVDPEIRKTFEKLGISLDETKRLNNVAIDAYDSLVGPWNAATNGSKSGSGQERRRPPRNSTSWTSSPTS